MIVSIFFLLALVSSGDAYVLARRVEQKYGNRATFQGGWGLSNPTSCPANYSKSCGPSTNVNQLCCPDGNTCFGTYTGYCCPSSQDCTSYVNTFPACADPTANMYAYSGSYFCCAQGLTGVIPTSGFPFCESGDVSVAVTLLATMVSQYGGTSVTPFGGFATITGTAANTGAGVVTDSNPTPTSSSTSPKTTSTSSSTFAGLSTPALIGIIVGGLIVLTIAMSIWRWCKAKVRKSIDDMDRSHGAGPSMMPAYIPTNVQIYEPAPTRPYGDVYDPVLERHTAISPMSPIPATPSPSYSAVDPREVLDGRGMYDPIEVHGVGSARGRVEMA